MRRNNTFYCFSPPVMIITMVVETAMLFYVLFRYKLNAISRIIFAIIILLAIFQLAEFNVCGGYYAQLFTRIGFVAITILPALGIHLVFRIAKKSNALLISTVYSISGLFAVTLGLSKTAFLSHVCGGNYAIFMLANRVSDLYFVYYYALLFTGIGLALYFAHTASHKIRRALHFQVIGYLCFLLPTGLVNTINPSTINGIPSIMCGFAVFYAFILVFGVLPAVTPKTKK